MRFVLASMVSAVLAFSAGCIPSVHAIYSAGAEIIAPDLQGVWISEDANETWEFRLLQEEKKYDLDFTDAEGRLGRFEAVLTEINGQLFMDMFPKPPGEEMNAFYTLHMVPAHTFMQIDIAAENVELRLLDFDWLENYLITDPEAIKHEKTDQLPLLTARTPELRDFLGKTMAIDGTWSDAVVLNKMMLEQPAM